MKIDDTSYMSKFKEKAGFIIACLFFIMAITINILPFLDGKNDLMDFGSFYASGLKIQSGENPYDPNSEYIFEINFSRVGAGGKMMNLNPPISVVLFRPLARFDPHQTLVIWQVISAILYAGSIILLGTTYKQNVRPAIFLWAFTLAGFWHTLVLGQIYVVLLLFTALGLILLKERSIYPGGSCNWSDCCHQTKLHHLADLFIILRLLCHILHINSQQPDRKPDPGCFLWNRDLCSMAGGIQSAP